MVMRFRCFKCGKFCSKNLSVLKRIEKYYCKNCKIMYEIFFHTFPNM